MKAVLDPLGFLQSFRYGVSEGSHPIFVATSDDSIRPVWDRIKSTSQFIIPEHHLNFDDALKFIQKRLCVLEKDGCILVPYRVQFRLEQVEFGLVFAEGARHIGPEAADGQAFSDSPENLASKILDLICVHGVTES